MVWLVRLVLMSLFVATAWSWWRLCSQVEAEQAEDREEQRQEERQQQERLRLKG